MNRWISSAALRLFANVSVRRPRSTNDACSFAARRERTRRFKLVQILDHQHVGIVHSGGFNVDHDLARARNEIGDFFEHQGFGAACRFAHFVKPGLRIVRHPLGSAISARNFQITSTLWFMRLLQFGQIDW